MKRIGLAESRRGRSWTGGWRPRRSARPCPSDHSAADRRRTTPRPALWQVSDADTTIYLFGTIHALPGERRLAHAGDQSGHRPVRRPGARNHDRRNPPSRSPRTSRGSACATGSRHSSIGSTPTSARRSPPRSSSPGFREVAMTRWKPGRRRSPCSAGRPARPASRAPTGSRPFSGRISSGRESRSSSLRPMSTN